MVAEGLLEPPVTWVEDEPLFNILKMMKASKLEEESLKTKSLKKLEENY